jgi:hypothetical protein
VYIYECRKRIPYAIWTSILVWVATRVRARLELIWIGFLTWLGYSCRSSSSAYLYPSTWFSHKFTRIIILFNRIYYQNQEMNYLGTSSHEDLGEAWILCMLLLWFSKLKTKERHVFGWWMGSPRSLWARFFLPFMDEPIWLAQDRKVSLAHPNEATWADGVMHAHSCRARTVIRSCIATWESSNVLCIQRSLHCKLFSVWPNLYKTH